MELNDFVSKLWFEHNGQPCMLLGLPVVEDAEVLIQYPDGKFEETKMSELNPIPITREFMEKNGYENDDIFSKRHFQNAPMYRIAPQTFLVIFANANVCGICVWMTFFGDKTVQDKFRSVAEIKYVHEFQQIMWLIDKSKQIIV